ncbi:peptidoglycan DD-metalloendopeptidase family protein [Polaromonas sp.]|jgi:lipoprotein NlpD|uniref:peptidoglycan DD-metalloendopeptidase family protein n=1 Tax=Polaromonas sp. TaxID=1869339 RepID=UPI001D38032E|nr:peptidoglycan DD-metalloendopeptidase family protein [Polaromonas sp.]MBT9474359.1 peptidoglycan DD-metalloendopeptidase family protein [Polaromonas sp.]
MNQTERSNKAQTAGTPSVVHSTRLVRRLALPCALAVAVLLAAGCASHSNGNAPVEDRGTGQPRQLPGVDVKQLPGFENAGKPGYYAVKPGDTMIRIGLENGQNWRDIVRWNGLENPNLIEVGQVLRVMPPVVESAVAVTRPVSPGAVTAAASAALGPAKPASAALGAAPAPVPAPVSPAPPASNGDEDVAWIWPVQGALIAGFDEAKNKGLDISGKAGDTVMASADGRVVYAGAGLRGYGNLVILKHNNTFLTAYAHNQKLFVKEDQTVRKGQKIAEMGNSDADRVKLHFEIRRQGKPVDPAKYLPAK